MSGALLLGGGSSAPPPMLLGTVVATDTGITCSVLLDGSTAPVQAVVPVNLQDQLCGIPWAANLTSVDPAIGARIMGARVGSTFYVTHILSGGRPSAAGYPNYQYVEATSATSITTTTATQINGLTLTILSTGTSDVWKVGIGIDMTMTTSPTTSVTELFVDTTAQRQQIIFGNNSQPLRVALWKNYRVTGLAAGAHTLTARSRNSTAVTTTIQAQHSVLESQQVG